MTTAKEFVNVFPDIVHIIRPQSEIENLGDYIREIYAWSKERHFQVNLTNTWSEGNDEHTCFEVKDETQRFWFALKWK